MGKMKELSEYGRHNIIFPIGLILQSTEHGGYIIVVRQERFIGPLPIEYACLNKNNGLITTYGIEELYNGWLGTGYYDKTVVLLYGSRT